MTAAMLLAIVIFAILAGVLAVRVTKIIKHKKLVALRVSQALGANLSAPGKLDKAKISVLSNFSSSSSNSGASVDLLERTRASIALVPISETGHSGPNFRLPEITAPLWVMRLIEQSALAISFVDLLTVSLACALLPALIAYICALDWLVCFALALVASILPLGALSIVASRRRTKFIEQLPDAIDLMVSVLRSGHSISQAVRSVGKESAQPLGQEFAQVLQRINLGQPFGEALNNTVAKYRSDELDLIRRAITIQAEVGGSLAELLDKTNLTLRQRLKLKRQVKVLTSQSKLTGIIVALLPILLACALEFLSPGYLEPLVTNELGRMLLALAVVLELVGIFLINKMTEVKI